MVKRGSKSSRRSDRYITGKQGLALIDGAVSRARTALDHAVRSADETAQRRGEVRRDQAEGFQALAKFRLEKLQLADDNLQSLTEAEDKASRLLAQHAEFIETEYAALQALTDEIEAFEGARGETAEALSKAVQEQEETAESILSELAQTEAYQALEGALREASAVTDRATHKLELAEADRSEKSDPYEGDPLFSYLWERRFRTPDYKGNGLTKMLDGWVARLCGYDKAHLTYARLTELPERLAEHVAHVEALEGEAEASLKALESKALKEGGLEAMEAEATALRDAIRKLDQKIEAAEEAHLVRSEDHTKALQAETGPAEQARQVLAGALRQMSFPDLRVLVAQTVELEDDEIVDDLVKLRAEEMQLDLEMTDQNTLPKRRGRDLKQIEALRKGYKRASYASGHLLIDQSVLEDVISDLNSGTLNLEKALKRIRKTIKRSNSRSGGGPGGGRHRSRHRSRRRSRGYRGYDTAYGFEDVAATVVIELTKAAMRGGGRRGGGSGGFGGGSSGGGSSGGGSGKSGGGYKTGGRF